MLLSETSSSADLVFSPRKSTRIQYQIFQVYGSWQHVKAAGTGWVPSVDLYETDSELVVEINLAGINPEEVRVQFEGDLLHITGQRPESHPERLQGYYIMEIERGHFARTIELPLPIDPYSAEATSRDGLLQLRVRKSNIGFIQGTYPADSMEGLE